MNKRLYLPTAIIAALLTLVSVVLAREYLTVSEIPLTIDGGPLQPEGAGLINLTVSSDGRYIAFFGWANNLDSSGSSGLFVHDRTTGINDLIDDKWVLGPTAIAFWISTNGRYVLYEKDKDSKGGMKTSAWLFDRKTRTKTRVGTGLDNQPLKGEVFATTMSDDGRYIVYATDASNP
ncbi:MAG TPA: hypothetical protein VHL11_12090, partial [Phototrophicaceae bacterium]|nr:hypothetical protein [Phototrophicaceae bacterium]